MFIGLITLLSALSISAVAIYYSVIGLTAIFSAAAMAIIIMGVSLEVGKLVTVVWLHQNWNTAPKLVRGYLTSALVVLMLITSMGIFGFLSKAHMDQGVPTGDIADKVSLIDEKIKTQKDNIDLARKALRQMDESVDQVMARSNDEKGADKAAALRRAQAKERATLQGDVARAQKEIASLNEERAPAAKELRKVEAEVGPIKYIANFFYGATDDSILEKAVTWVIMTLIFVFDPLAIVLLIAAQVSIKEAWDRRKKVVPVVEEPVTTPVEVTPVSTINDNPAPVTPWPFPVQETPKEEEFKFLADYDEMPPGEHDEVYPDEGGDEYPTADIPDVERPGDYVTKPLTAEEELIASVGGIEAWNRMIAEAEAEVEKERQLQDEAAKEALKWAQEQEDARLEEESKKKELTWMEKEGNQQVKKSKPE